MIRSECAVKSVTAVIVFNRFCLVCSKNQNMNLDARSRFGKFSSCDRTGLRHKIGLGVVWVKGTNYKMGQCLLPSKKHSLYLDSLRLSFFKECVS